MRETDMLRAGLYVRVSTDRQETENQEMQLREYCRTRGWEIVQIYSDEARSGGDSDRPALKAMFEDAQRRTFDVLLFWSLDRFSREGVLKTILRLTELESCGVKFVSFSEQYLSTLGPFRDAIIALLAALAKQERIRLSERVKAGLERARAQGKELGRPRLEDNVVREILNLRKQGKSYAQISEAVGRTRSSVEGVCRRYGGVSKR